MKSRVLTLIICLCCFCCIAQKKQKTNYEHPIGSELRSVTLIDGSHLMGKILEDNESYLLLELIDGEQVKLGYKNIRKISKARPNHYFLANGKSFKNRGYFSHIRMGNAFIPNWGRSERTVNNTFNTHIINGYQFSDKLAVGLGLGLNCQITRLSYFSSHIPVYAYARSMPFSKKISPYYAIGLGYGFIMRENWRDGGLEIVRGGGYMVNPSLGLRFASRHSATFTIEAGYTLQNNTEYSYTTRQMWLNVGMIF